MPSPTIVVRNLQRLWAAARGIAVDSSGYTLNLNDNLFIPLSEATLSEFAGGDGGELGLLGERGKMQALQTPRRHLRAMSSSTGVIATSRSSLRVSVYPSVSTASSSSVSSQLAYPVTHPIWMSYLHWLMVLFWRLSRSSLSHTGAAASKASSGSTSRPTRDRGHASATCTARN
jgi:hypothetical protein